MVWAKNGTPNTLTSAGDTLTISDLTASKFNMFLHHGIASSTIQGNVTIDNNGNTDYAYRISRDGASDITGTSVTSINVSKADASDVFMIAYVINIDGEEKLWICQTVGQETAGAGTAPFRQEHVNKVDTTTNSGQFTRVDYENQGAGSYDTDSNLSALNGDTAEENLLGNVQDGTRFEATDTRKIYYGALGDATPDFSSDFSSSTGWTTSDSGAILVDTTNQDISWTVSRGTNDSISYDLGSGSVSDDSWILRWRTRWSSIGDSATNQQWFGISSHDYSNAHNVSQDFLGLLVLYFNTDRVLSTEADGTSIPASGDVTYTASRSTDTWYYYEVKRTSSTSFEISVSSTDSYTKDLYNSGSLTCDSTISGLRYIKLVNENAGTGSDGTASETKDFKFWNGVTSVPQTIQWTEET